MSRYADAPLDRLSHCQDKLHCLSCLNMELVGGGDSHSEGLVFLLRDIALDLKEIEEELWEEKKSTKTQDKPPKV